MVDSIGCSTQVDSQHPQGSSHLSVTPVPKGSNTLMHAGKTTNVYKRKRKEGKDRQTDMQADRQTSRGSF